MSTSFWKDTPLNAMTLSQWEALCDHCGKCCLHKLQDEDTEEILYTAVACRLFNVDTGSCKDYENRLQQVAECLYLKADDPAVFQWLPNTCAYRLLFEGKELPQWHYLVCGDTQEIHRQQESVVGKVISEENVHPDERDDYIIRWVE